MFKVSKKPALTYDDVQLVPCKSDIRSRREVSLATTLCGVDLKVPIITAPMDTITNAEMAKAVGKFGGLGIIHRFQSISDRVRELNSTIDYQHDYPVGVAVGLADDIDVVVSQLVPRCDVIVFDVAHAHTTHALEYVAKLRERIDAHFMYPAEPYPIMVGNIATGHAAIDFAQAGADIVKVGIGGGSCCSTRVVTGFGVPNITAIAEVAAALDEHKYPVKIVADGGIRSSGDIAKALAAGAHAAMVASLVAGTDETPGEIVSVNGKLCKPFRGMASSEAQRDWQGGLKSGTTAEGVAAYVPLKGKVADVLADLAGGLRSALSYAGAENLQEFFTFTEFVQVTPAGTAEAKPHILAR